MRAGRPRSQGDKSKSPARFLPAGADTDYSQRFNLSRLIEFDWEIF
jgi:hypothetical protein